MENSKPMTSKTMASKPMIMSRRVTLATIAGLPLFANFKPAFAGDKPSKYSLIGKKAPKFGLMKHGGGVFNNKNLLGKTTIVEFFGLWCPDCMLDAPLVAQLAAQANSTKGLAFIGVHTAGRYGRWGSLDKFFAEKGYSYPVAIDDDKGAYNAFQLQWVPSYIIIDKNGIIRDYTTDLGAGGIGVDALMARAKKIAGIK
jgi:thiol-disulfide isomerase/thioredoxin